MIADNVVTKLSNMLSYLFGRDNFITGLDTNQTIPIYYEFPLSYYALDGFVVCSNAHWTAAIIPHADGLYTVY